MKKIVYISFEVDSECYQKAEQQVKEYLQNLHEIALHMRIKTDIIASRKIATKTRF